MQVGVLSLLVAGLAFLVLGLTTGSTPLVLASTGASLLAVYVIVRVRREQQAGAAGAAGAAKASGASKAAGAAGAAAAAGGQRKTLENARVGAAAPAVATPSGSASAPEKPAHAARVPATAERVAPESVADERVALEPAAPEPARVEPVAPEPAADEPIRAEPARVEPAEAEPAKADPTVVTKPTAPTEAIPTAPTVVTAPAEAIPTAPTEAGDADDLAIPDPAAAETDPPLRSRGDEPVWVIDGRPRYHLPHCGFLLGRQSEPVPLRQAFEDGFSPCALCDPDSGLAAG